MFLKSQLLPSFYYTDRFPVISLCFCSLLFLCMAVLSCGSFQQKTRFRELAAEAQGISFQNTIHSTDSLNILTYMYYYNGGGVAVGDIDGDGLEDLFFAGNQVSSRLYRNLGNLQFEDISISSGTQTEGWVSGVSMIDINADGWLDIYACRTAHRNASLRQNLLFINQQDGTFSEMAEAYGLADTAYSTHAAFLDYDRDGDLDVYLLNHMHQFSGANDPNPRKADGTAPNTDRLLRNDRSVNVPHPVFTDLSQEAGIVHEGFGLGIAIADLNKDGWPDIYVSNDFISNDLMYLNNQNGTFTNQIAHTLTAQSHNGMGNDIADINQDALPDIFVADMLPETNARRKSMIMNTGYDLFQLALQVGYEPQYTRNTLQLNRGNGRFSEIAQLAGVHSTDWSWSPLFGDYDNDGDQDLLITNGHFKDLTDLDFIAYRRKRIAFTTQAQRDSLYLNLLQQIKGIHLKNYLYENKGTLQFQDKTEDWGIQLPSYSNGAIRADLDQDGDLDIVINNLNEPVSLYENSQHQQEQANWVQLALKGPDLNPAGIGAKVWLYANGEVQYQEQFLSRGFMSSTSFILHMGIGDAEWIDSVRVRWPDGNTQLLSQLTPNQLIQLSYKNAISSPPDQHVVSPQLFVEKGQQSGLNVHIADPPSPVFKREPLLPHSYAQQGPAVAIGDINGDGRDDVYAGGAAGNSGNLFFQTESGAFQQQAWEHNSAPEEVAAALLDADGDGDLDLYVVSGGSEYWAGSEFYQDRLYRNNGSGQFTWDSLALPEIRSSGSCITASDFDQDGDIDLFVGGRVIPGKYAAAPRSYLLLNEGGSFVDATQTKASGLNRIGMVSAALWTDSDQDGWSDLLLVGEWMPITLFQNHKGKLRLAPVPDFQFTSGWWNSLAAGDFDGDGDTDYVAGNLGLNTDFQASVTEPLTVIAGFLDGNRSWDALLSSFEKGAHEKREAFPIHPRDELLAQMPSLEKEFPDYQRYANADIADVLAAVPSKDSVITHSAFLLSSSYIENLGKNEFLIRPLPITAQFSPVFGLFPTYLDADPYLDLIVMGNFGGSNVHLGRYDASMGAVFAGNGKGKFMEIPPAMTGLKAIGDVRSVFRINRAPELPYWIVFRNNDVPLIYEQFPLAQHQVNQ